MSQFVVDIIKERERTVEGGNKSFSSFALKSQVEECIARGEVRVERHGREFTNMEMLEMSCIEKWMWQKLTVG